MAHSGACITYSVGSMYDPYKIVHIIWALSRLTTCFASLSHDTPFPPISGFSLVDNGSWRTWTYQSLIEMVSI